MAWLEAHQTLQGHPKTRKAALKLGVCQPQLIGHLFCLWWWALDYAQDGDLTNFAADDLAVAAEWAGDSDALIDALVECRYGDKAGFLERTGDGRLLIHDWHEYAGKLVERREANAARMRESRAGHVQRTPSINSGTSDTRATHVQRTQRARAERQNRTEEDQLSPPLGGEIAPDADAPDAPHLSAEPVAAVPKPKKLAPPRSPAVKVYWKATGKTPREALCDRIEATVPSDDDAALALWGRVIVDWMERGYKRENIAGMLDWYREGGPPARASPGQRQQSGRVSTTNVALSLLNGMAPEVGHDDADPTDHRRRLAPDASRVPARHGQAHPGLPAPRQH